MKSLQYAALGLGLSLGSCVSTGLEKSEYRSAPVVLYEHLIRKGQETPDKGRMGEGQIMQGENQIKATAVASPLGKGKLQLLVYNPVTRWGILYEDGIKGTLDGLVDQAVIRSPLASGPLYVSNIEACGEGYLLGSAALVTEFLKEPAVDSSQPPVQIIEQFKKAPAPK